MLLDDDLAHLTRECTRNFDPTPDHSALTRINQSLGTLGTARQHHTSSLQSTLQKLARQLNALESQHQYTVSNHNPAEHAAEILRLDTEKFRIAKSASDAEIEAERLEHELATLQTQLAELDAQGVEGGESSRMREGGEDEVVLKLKVYRSLGISVEPDPVTGAYTKACVVNRAKGDAHVVSIEPGKFSRFFYAGWFWKML